MENIKPQILSRMVSGVIIFVKFKFFPDSCQLPVSDRNSDF